MRRRISCNRIQATSTRGVRARIRRVAGCATPTGSAGHAGATANLKLTFHLDHSAGADHLARPGGNITGLTIIQTDLAAKQLEILIEAVPQAKRIGVLFNPPTLWHRTALQAVESAGNKLGVQLVMVTVRTVKEMEGAFETVISENCCVYIVEL